ncbi:GPI mannosyltransferase 2-like isoform X2 [Dysidea avara]
MRDVFWHGRREPPPYNWLVDLLVGGFTRWDSEWLLHVAHHGYQYEQCVAFFPLYPLMVHVLYRLASPWVPLLHDKDIILVCGVCVNICAFLLAGLVLFKLTNQMFHNPRLSHMTIILFCINPAIVFMTTTYTESLFTLLVFTGLWALHNDLTWTSAIIFSLATLTRSNGIILSGYLVWYYWVKCGSTLTVWCIMLIKLAIQVSMVTSGFVGFQWYSYWLFCHHDIPTPSGWCKHTIPISYSYVQRKYWDVGFMSYYQVKQIPNFLLATPTISLCSYWLYCCCHSNWRQVKQIYHWYWSNSHLIPYMAHMTFLLMFGVTSMHVQVITRMIYSSTPLVYWCGAVTIMESIPTLNWPSDNTSLPYQCVTLCKHLWSTKGCYVAKTIVTSYLLYCVIGTLLHCNYYPWT